MHVLIKKKHIKSHAVQKNTIPNKGNLNYTNSKILSKCNTEPHN